MDRFFGRGGGHEPIETAGWSPHVEVREEGNNLLVSADLPGLSKDEVKVEVTGEGLAIRGERKRQHEETKEGVYHCERQYGEFFRLIPLPPDAQIDQAKANFNNGVLDITIPVPQSQSKRREIPIEGEGRTKTSGGGA